MELLGHDASGREKWDISDARILILAAQKPTLFTKVQNATAPGV